MKEGHELHPGINRSTGIAGRFLQRAGGCAALPLKIECTIPFQYDLYLIVQNLS